MTIYHQILEFQDVDGAAFGDEIKKSIGSKSSSGTRAIPPRLFCRHRRFSLYSSRTRFQRWNS
jgi:hypothetical protein